jgi:hypothetical protein
VWCAADTVGLNKNTVGMMVKLAGAQMKRFNFLTLVSHESFVVAVPVPKVKHGVRGYTHGISTLESKSRDYKLISCNTAH